METIVVAICVAALLIIGVFLFNIFTKKQILKQLAEKYGKPSTRFYDERDFMSISQMFSMFPTKGKETVDDITWFDLQMPILYKQMNYSVSHIGDEYLYRHIRTQQYDELDRLEKHIQYFDAHPEERIKLQYAFYHINLATSVKQTTTLQTENQTIGNSFFAHLKNSNLFPQISIIPPTVILISAFLTCIFFFIFGIKNIISIVMLIVVFLGCLLYSDYFSNKTQNIFPTFKTFCVVINASEQIAKLDSHVFDRELNSLIPVLKKLQKKSKLMNELVDICMMKNVLIVPLSIIAFLFGLYGFVYQWAVKIIKNNTKEVMISYESIGYIELCISLSSYRKTLSYYCFPEFSKDTQTKFDELYHPLLQKPVTNSKTINQKLIITGANASGKSTFIKTLAINAITAQSINICYAKGFSLQHANIYTSMNLSDDIATGDSFYMAEIKRLKGFLDSLDKGSYIMFFVDEILKGTNTIERIAAASTILKRFTESNCFFCLATHDTELTSILQHFYSNYHFEETTTDTEIFYDYKLYDGVTPGSNAITLLKVMQYDQSIVDHAFKLAQYYINNSKWGIL